MYPLIRMHVHVSCDMHVHIPQASTYDQHRNNSASTDKHNSTSHRNSTSGVHAIVQLLTVHR